MRLRCAGIRTCSDLKLGFLAQTMVAEHRSPHSDIKEEQGRMPGTKHKSGRGKTNSLTFRNHQPSISAHMDKNIKTEVQPSQAFPFIHKQKGPEKAHWLMLMLKKTRCSKLGENSGGWETTRLFNTFKEFCYDSYIRM